MTDESELSIENTFHRERRSVSKIPNGAKKKMHLKVIDPSRDTRWDEFVCHNKYGSIYHHSAWMEVIRKTYRFIPKYYILEDDQGQIQSAFPSFLIKVWLRRNRLVSLPFTPFCDPLLTNGDDRLIDLVKEEIESGDVSSLEIRPFRNCKMAGLEKFQKINHYVLHILPLQDDLVNMWKCFHKSCIQRNIRKAEKNNIKIRRAEDEQDLKAFYHLYVHTKKRLGVPPHRYLFFKNIWDLFQPKNLVTVLLAEHRGKTIAGTMLLKFKDSYYYQFATSNRTFLKFRPNHLLLWFGIKQASEEGYQYFNLGRSAADQTGLILFKKRWGSEACDLPYFYYPKLSGIEAVRTDTLKFRLLSKMVEASPTGLLEIGSKLFYGYLG